MNQTIEALAKFLFERQAGTFTNDQAYIDQHWEMWEIREFWIEEATAIVEFMAPGVTEVSR